MKTVLFHLWTTFVWLQCFHLSSVLGLKHSSSLQTAQSLPGILLIRGGEILHLKSIEDTEEVVAENANQDQLAVIYFSATNCPPCKKVAPLFEEMSAEFEEMDNSKVVFCKVNVDENPMAAEKYQVTGWPTFLFLKKGEKVMEIVGGKLAEATLYDWVKLLEPKEPKEEGAE